MIELSPGMVLRSAIETGPLSGVLRVLHVFADQIAFIRVPSHDDKPNKGSKGKGRHKGVRYVKGAFVLPRATVLANANCLAQTTIRLPPHAYQTEQAVRERYLKRKPRRKKPASGPAKRKRRARIQYTGAPQLAIRDRHWDWVEPIVKAIQSNPEHAYLEGGIAELVGESVAAR